MVKYNFKDIGVVPSATSFVDIMLSRTNRQTPTIVRARWKISSIRSFYMRKVRFTQQNMSTRLSKILSDFPKLDSIHPFYSDLMNVLYDRDHYKIALSQLNIAKQLIINIGSDYIKLLKYGDSLYRCKHLKRAALGRMVKILKQQKSSLLYLEQVRQHLGRLPTIDPFEKTILLTGFPSSGKSSFMNVITNAKVEVASYPFTTKSLYVGHCDYNYLRYQVIDSPGILDRPLSQRNTIEMQAITALAHLNCCVLYFLDLSPLTSYSIESQCKLFHSLSPLFANKPIIVICNKIDLRTFDALPKNEQSLINKISKMKSVKMMQMSNESQMNVMNVRNAAADMLLSHRMEMRNKNKNNASNNDVVESRLFVAKPIARDNKRRECTKEPKAIANNKTPMDIKEIETANGGPGVFNFDPRTHWTLKNEEWKYDPIPQFYNGKNIADFYQKNIDKELNELENEEKDKLMSDLMNIDANDDAYLSPDDQLLNDYILRKHHLMRSESALNRKTRDSRPQIPRTDKKIPIHSLKTSLADLGINTHKVSKTVRDERNERNEKRGRSKTRSDREADDILNIARAQSRSKSRKATRMKGRSRSKSSGPPSKGISSITASQTAQKLKQKAMIALNKQGRVHESDRRNYTAKPLHLFKGKSRPKGR
eukprot:26067_1